MITLGICLIYYGIALFLYQMNGLLVDGRWTPFPVRRAWEGYFGSPAPRSSFVDWLVDWLLSWPLSLALMVSGLGLLALVFGVRWARQRRRDHLRRKWLAQQCAAGGYQPWSVPKVMRELEKRLLAEKSSGNETTR